MLWQWVAWAIIGYGCGSAPVGWMIARAHGIDIRRHGSGNVGATNVGRILGKQWGVLCLLLDSLKGLGPVALAGWTMGVAGYGGLEASQSYCWLAVAAAAVLGHVFPLPFGMRGGKGVATGLGALLGFWPLLTAPTLAAMVTWLLLASMFRYVSLASIVAAAAVPICLWLAWRMLPFNPMFERVQMRPFLIVTALMALLVLARHRSNLARLYAGTEPRLGQ